MILNIRSVSKIEFWLLLAIFKLRDIKLNIKGVTKWIMKFYLKSSNDL